MTDTTTENAEEHEEELHDETYGSYDEHPHTSIEMTYEQYQEGALEVLERRLGPPIAYEYRNGVLYLWGEHLDEKLLRQCGDSAFDVKQEHKHYDFFEAARAADQVESKFVFAEVENGAA